MGAQIRLARNGGIRKRKNTYKFYSLEKAGCLINCGRSEPPCSGNTLQVYLLVRQRNRLLYSTICIYTPISHLLCTDEGRGCIKGILKLSLRRLLLAKKKLSRKEWSTHHGCHDKLVQMYWRAIELYQSYNLLTLSSLWKYVCHM